MVCESVKITLPENVGKGMHSHTVQIDNVAAVIHDKDHLVDFLCMLQDAFTNLYKESVYVAPVLIQNDEDVEELPANTTTPIQKKDSA
jgi:hypothetical protein